MTTTEIKQIETPKVNDQFLRLTVSRNGEDGKPLKEGVMILAQSDILEEWFKTNSKHPNITATSDKWEISTVAGWDKHKAYPMTEVFKNSEMGKYFNNWGKELNISNVGPNLSFLRAKGLKEGVAILIPGLHTESSIKKFLEDVKRKSLDIYKEYMKPTEISLSIQFQEVI